MSRMKNIDLTASTVAEYLDYDPLTGIFTWRKWAGGLAQRERRAGHINKFGYVIISITRRAYKAHRLAWLVGHGHWPIGEIDHINGNKSDNRLANLRDVPRITNRQNQRIAHASNISSGLLGAYRLRSGSFQASITVRGKHVYLGVFDTAELAHQAHVEAKRRLHEGCTL